MIYKNFKNKVKTKNIEIKKFKIGIEYNLIFLD